MDYMDCIDIVYKEDIVAFKMHILDFLPSGDDFVFLLEHAALSFFSG